MRYIDIKINDNYIQDIEYKELIGGSYKNDFCHFSFDKEWEEFKDKFAVFVTENGSYKKALIDNECDIPLEIFNEKCRFGIGVYGILVKGQDNLIKRNSTNLVYIRCNEGAYKEDLKEIEAVENESIYEQYISKMNEIYSKIKQEHEDIIEVIDNKEIAVKRNIDEYAIEKVKEYNENAIQKIEDYNTNAKVKKEEIDAVAEEVKKDRTYIEEIEKRVKISESNAKTSETNASTSEQNAQNSAENASKVLSDVTGIQEGINASKTHIDDQKVKVDKSVEDVEKLVDEATSQANISKANAELSTTNAGQVSADKNAVENTKNEISSMKTSIEKTKSDTEQIKNDTQGIYNNTSALKEETLQAKTEVENSLENERNESDNKYSRALKDKVIDKDFCTIYADNSKIDGLGIKGEQLTQKVREGYNLLPYPYVETTKTKYGVTITDNRDGSITLNGTSTARIDFGYQWTNNLPNDFYTFITYGLPDTCYTNYYQIGAKYGESVGNFNKTATTENINIGAQLVIPEGVTLNNVTIYPMLVKGKYTRETIPVWEQYGASPSLEYPSQIETTNAINLSNVKENLIDASGIDKILGTLRIVSQEDGSIKYSGIPAGTWTSLKTINFKTPIKAGTKIIMTYGLDEELKKDNGFNPFLWLFNKNDDNFGAVNKHNILNKKPVKLEQDVYKLTLGIQDLIMDQEYEGQMYIELERTNIMPTEFRKYQALDYSVNLPEGQFNGAIGEYPDKIYANNRQNKAIQKLVLDGTENISMSSNGNIFRFRPEIKPIENGKSSIKTNAILSNCFTNQSFDDIYNANVENGIEIYNGLIQFRDSTINSVDDFKAKFKELYDAGTPVIIYYATNTVSVDLPDGTVPEIELMEGLNNVSIDKGTMSFEYSKLLARAFEEEREEKEDLKTRISNLENQIIELLGGN